MNKYKYLTIKQASDLLEISKFKVKNLIMHNHINCYGVNNLIPISEIEKFKKLYESTISLKEIKEYLYNTASINIISNYLSRNHIECKFKLSGAIRYDRKQVIDSLNKDKLYDKSKEIKDGYITIKEASKILKLKKSIAYRRLKKKNIKLIFYFDKIFVNRDSVIKLKSEISNSINIDEILVGVDCRITKNMILTRLKKKNIVPSVNISRTNLYNVKNIDEFIQLLGTVKEKELVNIKESQNILGCGYDRIKAFIKYNKLKPIKVSPTLILFDKNEVLQLKESLNSYIDVKELSILLGYSTAWVQKNTVGIVDKTISQRESYIKISDIKKIIDKNKFFSYMNYEFVLKINSYNKEIFNDIIFNDKLNKIIKESNGISLTYKRSKQVKKILEEYFISIDKIYKWILNKNNLERVKQYILYYNDEFYLEKVKFKEILKDKSNIKTTLKKDICSNLDLEDKLLDHLYNLGQLHDNYYSLSKALDILNESKKQIISKINKNKFKSTKIYKNEFYISKSDIKEYMKYISEIKNKKYQICKDDKKYIPRDKVCSILHITKSIFYAMIKTGELKKTILDSNIYVKDIDLRYYIKANNLGHFLKNYNDYVTRKQILDKYNLETFNLKHIKNIIKNCVKYHGNVYIYEPDVKQYVQFLEKLKKEYYSSKELKGILNKSPSTIRKYAKEKLIPGAILYDKKYYFKISEVNNFIKNEEKKSNINPVEGLIKSFKDQIKVLEENTDRKDCVKLMVEYYNYRLSKTKNERDIKTLNQKALKVYKYILENINTTIFNTNFSDLKFIINTNVLGSSFSQYMVWFFNYVIEKYNDKMKIKNKISMNKNYPKIEENPYSDLEWKAIYDYLTNLDFHKLRALKDPKWANMWLYSIFHLSNAWRASDIIRLPNLNLEVLNFDYSNILSKNLSLNDASILFDDIKDKCSNMKISKTSANIFLVMPEILLVPTMTSYVICEMHRRHNNKKNLIYYCKKGYYFNSSRDFKRFFKYSKFNDLFSNRRANKTLLSNTRKSFMESTNNMPAAVSIPQVQRGHKSIDSIKGYLCGNDKEISDKIIDRGHFGWLYKYILEVLADDNYKYNSFEDETKDIIVLKEFIPVKKLERISKYFLEDLKDNKIIAEKILKCDKEHFKEKIKNIYLGKSPSKTKDIDCLNIVPCTNQCKDKCFNCSQSLPRVQSIVSLTMYINLIISKLHDVDNINMKKKYSSILIKSLKILNDAVKEFGMEYINKFINIEELKNRLKSINKKIIYYGEN